MKSPVLFYNLLDFPSFVLKIIEVHCTTRACLTMAVLASGVLKIAGCKSVMKFSTVSSVDPVTRAAVAWDQDDCGSWRQGY